MCMLTRNPVLSYDIVLYIRVCIIYFFIIWYRYLVVITFLVVYCGVSVAFVLWFLSEYFFFLFLEFIQCWRWSGQLRPLMIARSPLYASYFSMAPNNFLAFSSHACVSCEYIILFSTENYCSYLHNIIPPSAFTADRADCALYRHVVALKSPSFLHNVLSLY